MDELEAARLEIKKLTRERDFLVRSCLNVAGDDLCWIQDPTIARALPEAEFLESCRRYRNQIAGERGEFADGDTIAQLEAKVKTLIGFLRLIVFSARVGWSEDAWFSQKEKILTSLSLPKNALGDDPADIVEAAELLLKSFQSNVTRG